MRNTQVRRRSGGELSRGEVPIHEVVEPGVDVIRTAVLGNRDNRRAPRRREVVWSSRPSQRFVEGAKRRLGELVENPQQRLQGRIGPAAAVLPLAQGRHGDAERLGELRLGKPELPANVPAYSLSAFACRSV